MLIKVASSFGGVRHSLGHHYNSSLLNIDCPNMMMLFMQDCAVNIPGPHIVMLQFTENFHLPESANAREQGLENTRYFLKSSTASITRIQDRPEENYKLKILSTIIIIILSGANNSCINISYHSHQSSAFFKQLDGPTTLLQMIRIQWVVLDPR